MSPETHISHGKVLQVIGPVVDVSFEGELPEIYTALRVSNPSISDKAGNLVLEVAQHIGEHVVRTIAMDFWASLEHSLRYKAQEYIPQHISDELQRVATDIASLDQRMQAIHDQVDELSDARSDNAT